MAMQYIKGIPLGEYCNQKTLSLSEKLKIINKIAKGLHYSHTHNIIHRDIKPSNIMVLEGKNPQIMDFGLAKSVRVSKKLTQTGEILGTPAYMSPEQALSYHVDLRSDIFSFGSVFYELVTGKRMFPGENTMDLLEKVASKTPPLPRWLNASIPSEVEAIILKCIQKNQNNRYQTMHEVSKDIEQFLSGKIPEASISYNSMKYHSYFHMYKKTISFAVILLISLICSLFLYIFRSPVPLVQRLKITSDATLIETFAKKLKKSPSKQGYLEYIKALQYIKNNKKALLVCKEAQEKNISDSTFCNTLRKLQAELTFSLRKYEKSEELYKELIQHSPLLKKKLIPVLFQRKKYNEIQKIEKEINIKRKKEKELCFYIGASKVLLFFQNRTFYNFLKDILDGKFKNNPLLNSAVGYLKGGKKKGVYI